MLTAEQATGFVREQLNALDLAGRSVCVLVPDGTRTCPLPLLMSGIHAEDANTLVVPDAGEVLYRLR